jgi:hypothetical protein
MSITIKEICRITIYAPSGAEKKREREDFFLIEVPKLIPTTPTELILAGDFNCTLASPDSTGRTNYSRALDNMIKTLDLKDVWTPTSRAPGYTYYGPRTASRIDRIYVTKQIQMRKPAVDLVATAFSDHHAVMINVPLSRGTPRRGRGYWKMNMSHARQVMAFGFRTTVEDLADAQEVLLQRSGVVVQVHQTDVEKTFHPDRHNYETGPTTHGKFLLCCGL